MQAYLLGADLFVLTALLLGLNNFETGRHSWRLLPLFLLVISRSLILIVFLSTSASDQPLASLALIAALEIFSTTCVVWTLINPVADLPDLWKRVIWLGGGAAFFLTLFPLIPDWPVPYQIHSLAIAFLGVPLILLTVGKISWLHLGTIFILIIANYLSLLDLTNVSWPVLLVGYGLFIGALHWENVQRYRDRQLASEALAQRAIRLSREKQRLLEVSEIISAVPNLNEALVHLARSMAHITHTDQSALFILDVEDADWAYLAAIYSPERPVDLMQQNSLAVNLANCEPLQAAIGEQPQQVIVANQKKNVFSESNQGGIRPTAHQILKFTAAEKTGSRPHLALSSLNSLYGLWHEERIGPTLIQPLMVWGRSVGALVLGNPVTKRLIREKDRVLCQSLAGQMATIVEAHRRYVELETQVVSRAEWRPVVEFDTTSAPVVEAMVAGEASILGGTVTAAPAQPAPLVSQVTSPPKMATSIPFLSDLQIDPDHYLTILETVDDGVVVSNATGRVKIVNTAAERMLGKSRQELLDQPVGTVYGKINSGESIEDLAIAFSRRNQPLPTYIEDDNRIIEGRLIPWRNADNEWLGIIAVFRDVTHQVKSEEARTNTITALSWVMRNPLGVIRAHVALMLGGMMGEYSSEQLHGQHIVHSNAEQIVEILDNALQINLLDKREILPNFEQVDVEQVVARVIQDITPTLQISQLELVKEIRTELLPVTADHKHLYRILENLLSNACRFTPPGGQITLRIWIQNEREGDITRPHLLLAVADNGVGIPQAEFKRIFDPFYQLDNQNPNDKPRLGMGLAVVKQLAEMHNGRAWVESTPGEGSIFQVSLPLSHQ
jgi:PAS domain S-box-containing protein